MNILTTVEDIDKQLRVHVSHGGMACPVVWIMDICVYYEYNGLITFKCERARANNGAHINATAAHYAALSVHVCICVLLLL